MPARTKIVAAGLSLVVLGASGIRVVAQTGMAKANWTLKVNETRGPVRAADVKSPLGKEAVSEILAGPTNGNDDGYVIFTRMPTGAHGPALFTLPEDHLYIVIEGKLNVQIGTDKFVADKYQAIAIPPNTPHEVWNADPQTEIHLEVVAPGSSRDLASMLKPAQARKVENAAQYIRKPKVPMQAELKPGLNGAMFAERKSGGTVQMRIDSTNPGQGGPKPHVHKFTQVYFSIDGATTVEYGLNTYPLPKYSVAIISPAAVHTNSNKTSAMERHVTLLIPEPKDRSEPFDIEYEKKGAAGPSTPTTQR